MGIKEFLAEGNRDFISLYDLLQELEKQQNVTHQEAAAWLYRNKEHFPTWYSFSIAGGKETFDGIENGGETYLFLAASGTSLSNSFFHDLQMDRYLQRAKELGFSAIAMMEFLSRNGVAVNLNGYTQPVLSEHKQQAKEEKAGLQENSETKQKQENAIGTLVSENENLKRELERLKTDQLLGKNKTSLMKLIATMARQGYRAEISNGRISHIKEIVDDSQRNGTPLNETTVRNILNEALKLNE